MAITHNYNAGYAVVGGDPNTITALQALDHKMKLAISDDGNQIWRFVPANNLSSRWVPLDLSDDFFSGDYDDLTNLPTIPTNNNQLSNGAGYITSGGNITGSVITGTSFTGNGANISNVNAQQLDGIDSTQFVRADIDDVVNGRLSFGNNSTNRDGGVYGVYTSVKVGHIWSMSTSHRILDDGSTFGNLYGAAYYHTNTGLGTFAGGHQSVWCQDGVPYVAMGTNLWVKEKIGVNKVSPAQAVDVEGSIQSTNVNGRIIKLDSGNGTIEFTGSSGVIGLTSVTGISASIITLNNNNTVNLLSTITATNFILNSDKRLKTNIGDFKRNIKVNWKTFELKSELGVERYGVVAQELEKEHPEFVRTDNKGMKSVAYVDLLIAKIAELENRLIKAGI